MQGLRALTRYFDFRGRSGRAEFWQFIAMSAGIGWIIQAVEAFVLPASVAPVSVVMLVYSAAIFIPQCSVAVRRLHDRGRSGWLLALWLAVLMIGSALIGYGLVAIDQSGDRTIFYAGLGLAGMCVVGGLLLVVEWARPGDGSTNRFGPLDRLGEPVPPHRQQGLTEIAAVVQPAAPVPSFSPDLLMQLERIGSLRDQGVLTEQEFATTKAHLLAGNSEPSATGAPAPPTAHPFMAGSTIEAPAAADHQERQPTSAIWQERFDFYNRYGLHNTPEGRRAMRSQGLWTAGRLTFSPLAFILGPFYFVYLGLWRPALVLLAAGLATDVLIDPLIEQAFPGSTAELFSPYQAAAMIAFAGMYGTTAIPLYYLKRRFGVETWNPFRRRA